MQKIMILLVVMCVALCFSLTAQQTDCCKDGKMCDKCAEKAKSACDQCPSKCADKAKECGKCEDKAKCEECCKDGKVCDKCAKKAEECGKCEDKAKCEECCKDGKMCQKCANAKELEAYMAIAAKYGQPGKFHQILDKCVGNWKAVMKMYGTAGNVLCTSDATAERKWILGGRLIQEEYKDADGFVGFALMGYDNKRQCFFNIWFDNMSTGYMVSEGNYDEAGKIFTMTSAAMNCPVTGSLGKTKAVSHVINDNEELFEMYWVDSATGKEIKNMEIKYTRK